MALPNYEVLNMKFLRELLKFTRKDTHSAILLLGLTVVGIGFLSVLMVVLIVFQQTGAF